LIEFVFPFLHHVHVSLPLAHLISAPRAFVIVLVVAELFVRFFSSLETGSSKSEHETLATFRTRNGARRLYLVVGHDPTLYAIILVQVLDIVGYD